MKIGGGDFERVVVLVHCRVVLALKDNGIDKEEISLMIGGELHLG